MLWNLFQKLSNHTKVLSGVSVSLLGLGFARAWLWWILEQTSYVAFSSLTEYDAHLLFDIGEIIGFFALAFFARRFSPYLKKGFLLIPSALCMVFASVIVVLDPLLQLESLAESAVSVMGGFGYALLLLMWLELYGNLSTKNMILAWSYSFLVGFVIRNIMIPDLFTWIAALLPLASIFMLAKGYVNTPLDRLPTAKAAMPPIPKRLVGCLAAIAFAFGIGDVISGQNMFGPIAQLGMAIPEIFVIAGFLIFPKRFDINILLFVSPIFISLGVGISFFTDFNSALSVTFMYASSQAYLILAYTIGCTISHRLNCSSVFLCGIFAGVHKLFLQIGKQMTVMIAESQAFDATVVSVLGIATLIIILIASILVASDRGVIDRLSVRKATEPSQQQFNCLAVEFQLTPKEESLLPLLAQGLNSSEIADELFLAPSTIRVHISNIYKKLDIHSRKELIALLGQQ